MAVEAEAMRDHGIVPLICPTCQTVFEGEASLPAANRLLCMGLFSIFWLGGERGPPSPDGLRRGSLRPLRFRKTCAGLPSRSSRSERRLVGPAGLEPATRPLWAAEYRSGSL